MYVDETADMSEEEEEMRQPKSCLQDCLPVKERAKLALVRSWEAAS